MRFIIFFVFLPLFVQAQKPNLKVDSLERLLKTAKDTNKVNTYMELVRALASSKPDKAIEYANLAQKEAILLQFKKGQAQALTALASIHILKAHLQDALLYQKMALNIYEDLKDKKGIGISLANIGIIYSQQNNYPMALENFQEALKIREDLKDDKGILYCLNGIGAVYTKQANENPTAKKFYEKSRDYYERGLPIAKRTKNEALEASLLNNIGGTFDNQEDYEKALDYYLKALAIYEKTHNKFYLVSSYHSIGDVYLNKAKKSNDETYKTKNLEIAETYQQKSLKIAEDIKDKNGIAQAKFGLANIKVARKQYHEAIEDILPTLPIFTQTGARDKLAKSKKLLAEIYEVTGDFRAAHREFKDATALKDSIFNKENSKTILNLQESFEISQRDAKIKLQAEEQKAKDARQALTYYLLAGLAAILLLVVVGLVYVYRSWNLTRKLNTQINQQVILLKEQQEEINVQNEELHQSREEIMAHRDELAETNLIIEKEREKSDNLLLNILPTEVAEELKEKGSATARHYKKVSVLFTDFQGFTKRTAGMTPEQVIAELNQCFSKFDAIIDKYNLEKIKTIGDAYMCAGGLPIPNTTNPIDAVRAGLEIQAYMEAYRAECEAKGEAYFRCRLGINTGEVVAGVVGTKKFAYDIWGDTVNTASRAESGGEVGMVNITEATYQEVKDYFECEYRGQIEVKGKGSINMYFVLREKK